jgi:hypothetical protein
MTEREQRLRDCLLAPNNATHFGQDDEGELYVQDGKVYRVRENGVDELGDYFEFRSAQRGTK